MSMKAALEEIVKQMEEDRAELVGQDIPHVFLKNYIRSLKIILAAEPDAPPPRINVAQQAGMLGAETQHVLAVEAERMKIRAEREKSMARVEEKEPVLRICRGGPAEGVSAPCDAAMPPGAKVSVEGAAYELRADGYLYVCLELPKE